MAGFWPCWACPRRALRADSGWDDHWVLRGVAVGLREPSAAVPVFNPVTQAYLGQVPLAQNDWDSAFQASLRNYGGWELGQGLRLEWSLLAGKSDTDSAGLSPTAQPLGRSAALERRVFGDAQHLDSVEVDQLNLRWQGPQLSVAAGRQSVNLGQNFYFSALDLFEPFNPQDNYRDFRARRGRPPRHLVAGTFHPSGRPWPWPATRRRSRRVATPPSPRCGWTDRRAQGSPLLLHAESGADAWASHGLGRPLRRAGVWARRSPCNWKGLGSSWILEGLAGQVPGPAALGPDPGAGAQATLGLDPPMEQLAATPG